MNDTLARAPYSPAWSSLAEPIIRPDAQPAEPRTPWITVAPTRDQRRARPRLFYAVVACAGVAAIFIAKLLLSVALSQGAYETSHAQDELKQLQHSVQAIGEDLDRVKSPQYLAQNAAALGMVANAHPAYLRLSDGAVLGQPQAADAATGGAGNAVPNALLAGVPLVTDPPPAAATAPVASTVTAPPAPSVEPTSLPTPVTH